MLLSTALRLRTRPSSAAGAVLDPHGASGQLRERIAAAVVSAAVAGTPLDFLGAVGFLMGRLGEEVTVTVGLVNPPSLVVQLSGTLAAKGSDVFDTGAAGEPVAFGFDENDATFYLDPSTFKSARSGGNVLEADLGYVQLEVNEPPVEDPDED